MHKWLSARILLSKLKAVEVAEKQSKETATRQFNVDPKRIRECFVLRKKGWLSGSKLVVKNIYMHIIITTL